MSIMRKISLATVLLFIIFSILYICPDDRENKMGARSSQLKRTVKTGKNAERTDYSDASGKITFAADLGYASKIVTYTDNGTEERYYDDQGQPISGPLGYYGILREYDENGNNICITYLDSEGRPIIRWGGYATEKIEYDEEGNVLIVRYYDEKGAPVSTPAYGCGKVNEYNAQNDIVRITCINETGKPMMTKQGYAIICREYYRSEEPGSGKTEKEMYFDESGNPACLSLGQYGVYKEYNEYGLETILTYLDAKGKPTITNKGYTTIKRTFHDSNMIATERYFDIDGNPFSLSDGEYGIKREGSQIIYLDENGQEVFSVRRLLYNNSWVVIPIVLTAVILSVIFGKKQNIVLLIICIVEIVYMTLLFRDRGAVSFSGVLQQFRMILIDSAARADIIKNIWLFIPLGAILYKLHPKATVLFVPITLAVMIEGIQLLAGTGTFELDDIISNSLGGWIGFCMARLSADIKPNIIRWKHNTFYIKKV